MKFSGQVFWGKVFAGFIQHLAGAGINLKAFFALKEGRFSCGEFAVQALYLSG
jgi:hypothetical protein